MEVSKVSTIYKLTVNHEDYPNGARLYRVQRGDRIFIYGNEEVKLGAPYRNYPAIVTKIEYTHKKWWQFWKKKEQIGFLIEWLAVEATDEQLVAVPNWIQGTPEEVGKAMKEFYDKHFADGGNNNAE